MQDGWVYVEIRKGIYGLPWAGLLAQELLKKWLAKKVTHRVHLLQACRNIKHDNLVLPWCQWFLGEICGKRICQAFEEHFRTTLWGVDGLEWNKLCWTQPGLGLWQVRSLPSDAKIWKWFQHSHPQKPQHQPYPHVPPKYGQKQQLVEPEYTAPHLDKKTTKFIKDITGTFLFYACAIDSTMLTAFSAITAE